MGSKGKSRFKMPRGPAVPQRQQIEQLQSQMAQLEASLAETVVTATAGGGAVIIEMTGDQQLRSLKIKPEVVDPEDVEMLQDLIMAAFTEAMEKSRRLAAEKFGPLTGGLDIAGLL